MRYILRALVITLALAPVLTDSAFSKEKSSSNQYPLVLSVDESGTVIEVTMQETTPSTILQKAEEAFIGKKLAVKRQAGKAVSYQQKIVISTKHLISRQQLAQQ